MALPSEVREINRIKSLPEVLGKTSFIESQDLSDRLPKLVARGRERVYSEPIYRISQFSAGGDVALHSLPICDEDRSIERATLLARFTSAVVRL